MERALPTALGDRRYSSELSLAGDSEQGIQLDPSLFIWENKGLDNSL